MVPYTVEHPWYALRIRSRHEKVIAATLFDKGYEVFLPLHSCKPRWSDRIKEIELPLFPGYLFCRFDMQKRLPVLVTPGIIHIVGIGNQAMPIADDEIAAIQAIVVSRLEATPWPYLQIGQSVRIEQGPLLGLEGILLGLKKPYRLIVSVTLLQRSVAVEIDHDWVSPLSQAPVHVSPPAIPLAQRI